MSYVFIKAEKEGTIYIKVDSFLLETDTKHVSTDNETLLDVLQDNGYEVTASNEKEWNNYIEYGLSYEIDTIHELEEFKEINVKADNIRNGKV